MTPFRDTCYPKNGWGCECYVTSESEYEAKNNGREVLSSGEDGEEPDIPGVDRDKSDPAWKYNSGREAPAPNFNKYEHLSENTLKDIYAAYRNSMDNTRLAEGEFKILLRRTNEADYGPVPRSPFPTPPHCFVQTPPLTCRCRPCLHGMHPANSRLRGRRRYFL